MTLNLTTEQKEEFDAKVFERLSKLGAIDHIVAKGVRKEILEDILEKQEK